MTELQRKLEETHNKVWTLNTDRFDLCSSASSMQLLPSDLYSPQVERLELSVQRLRQEKEEQCRVMAVQEQQASVTLREETQRLSIQNQELLHQVTSFSPQLLNLPSCLSSEHESCRFQLASLQAKQQEAQNLNHEQQNLKTRLSELETERTKANEQVPQ